MRIALGNGSLASYPPGGGHWSWFLQYPLGLRALGHQVFWLELLRTSGDRARDLALIGDFFVRIRAYDLDACCALLLLDTSDVQDFERAESFGMPRAEISRRIADADMLWSMSCAIREPLLSRFRHPVLIDTDPGHLQVSAQSWDLGINRHEAFLTVGTKIQDSDCEIPTLGLRWRPFLPFVYLPIWERAPSPSASAPITSITQWTWEELPYAGRMLSASKRTAYMRYAELPRLSGRAFELAANIGEDDPAGDRASLRANGWTLVDPHAVAATPEAYRAYIRRSRAEILCPKPIYRELRTGWLSDRSACYLATGRPVIAEETGFSERVATGRGLLSFTDMAGALDAVREIDADYAAHSDAARAIACELFDSAKCLRAMLDASG
ncbi:MAG: glycosyltransferase [Candidatus Binataceae bacterium]